MFCFAHHAEQEVENKHASLFLCKPLDSCESTDMENLGQNLVNVVLGVASESVTLVTWSVGVWNPAENPKRFADLVFIVVRASSRWLCV